MKPDGNGQYTYSVVYSASIEQKIDDMATQAVASGIAEAFGTAMEVLLRKLEIDPLGFGEAKYHLSHLQLVVCTAAVSPVFVRYGVREDLRLVFLVEVRWL